MLLQNEVKYLFKKIEIAEEEKIALSDELNNAKCLHNNQSNMLKDLLSDSKKTISSLQGEHASLKATAKVVRSQLEQSNKRCKELRTEAANLNSFREENKRKEAALIDLSNYRS